MIKMKNIYETEQRRLSHVNMTAAIFEPLNLDILYLMPVIKDKTRFKRRSEDKSNF